MKMTYNFKKEWTIADTYKLTEMYENNPCIWNPKYKEKFVRGEVLYLVGSIIYTHILAFFLFYDQKTHSNNTCS